MVSREWFGVVPGIDLRAGFAGFETLSIDNTRNIDVTILELGDGLPEQLTLFGSRRI